MSQGQDFFFCQQKDDILRLNNTHRERGGGDWGLKLTPLGMYLCGQPPHVASVPRDFSQLAIGTFPKRFQYQHLTGSIPGDSLVWGLKMMPEVMNQITVI